MAAPPLAASQPHHDLLWTDLPGGCPTQLLRLPTCLCAQTTLILGQKTLAKPSLLNIIARTLVNSGFFAFY
jgi:hypothetical protein